MGIEQPFIAFHAGRGALRVEIDLRVDKLLVRACPRRVGGQPRYGTRQRGMIRRLPMIPILAAEAACDEGRLHQRLQIVDGIMEGIAHREIQSLAVGMHVRRDLETEQPSPLGKQGLVAGGYRHHHYQLDPVALPIIDPDAVIGSAETLDRLDVRPTP